MNSNFSDLKKRAFAAAIGIALLWITYKYAHKCFFSGTIAIYALIALWKEWFPLVKKGLQSLRFFTPIYPITPFILFILLNQSSEYRLLIPIIFISVFAFDTGAYLAGKTFGKNYIAPKLSPKKSWEGFIGGYILSFISLLTYCFFATQNISFLWLFFVVALISIFSTAGDLFESFIKRQAGVKDSGKFLPGHGGLLDRVDSILFVVVFFYIFRKLLVTIF